MISCALRLFLVVFFLLGAAHAQDPAPTETVAPGAQPTPTPAPRLPRAQPAFDVDDIRHPEREWRDDYPDLPEAPGFTPTHTAFWESVILSAGENAAVQVEDSATFAAEEIVDAYAAVPPDLASMAEALAWLDAIYPRLDPTTRGAVAGSMGAAFTAGDIDIRAWLEIRPETEPITVTAAMQTCLTLGLFGSAGTLHEWLRIPETMRGFLDKHGVMLFDGDVLDANQLASLGSIFDSIPFEVHGVVSVVVPEGMRASANDFGLRTPGLVLDINAIPMDIYSNPNEFFPASRQTGAPEFTVNAAVQVMRATQFIQFQQRPELAHRQATILSTAGNQPTRYLRQLIAPAAYQSAPNELVPATSYLWFMDSSRAWGMALDLAQFDENEATDALLLVADTLSAGTDSSLAFQIDAAGKMRSEQIPLRRTVLAPGIAYASGIGIDGRLWTFTFDDKGGVSGGDWN